MIENCVFCGQQKLKIVHFGVFNKYEFEGFAVFCENCKARGPIKNSKNAAYDSWLDGTPENVDLIPAPPPYAAD